MGSLKMSARRAERQVKSAAPVTLELAAPLTSPKLRAAWHLTQTCFLSSAQLTAVLTERHFHVHDEQDDNDALVLHIVIYLATLLISDSGYKSTVSKAKSNEW